VGAYLAYEMVRVLVAPSADEASSRALHIIRFEQRAGIFLEPHLQRHILDHHWLVTLFNWIYVWGYLPVIAAAGIYLYVWHRSFYNRYRNAFLLSGVIGLIIFATLPVAPPRMFPEFGFVDTVRANSKAYSSFDHPRLVNQFAAVPSFHFGWILLVGLAVLQTTRNLALKALGMVMPVAMLLSIIFTANHYLFDAAIGGAIVLLALGLVCCVERVAPRARPLAHL
jgi:hypothetical protein